MILAMLLSLGLTALLCAAMIPLVRRIRLVDYPDQRKAHGAVTPLAGGPALLLVFLLGALYLGGESRFLQGLALGGTILFLIGLIDDLRPQSAALRIAVQIVACLVMIYHGETRLDDFGRLFRDDTLELGRFSALITVFAALGVINAFNMVDGMDGLAGSIFLVAAAGLALLAGLGMQPKLLVLLLWMVGAVLGFLLWNGRFRWNPNARLFLGDSGSLLLGFVLAWSFIALGNDHNEAGARACMPITAVWLVAVPLLDTSTQIWRRWRAGLSPFVPDRQHLHHAFLRAGYSVRQAWLGIALLALALGAAGLLLELARVPDYVSFWSFMAFAYAYYFYMKYAWRRHRFLGRNIV